MGSSASLAAALQEHTLAGKAKRGVPCRVLCPRCPCLPIHCCTISDLHRPRPPHPHPANSLCSYLQQHTALPAAPAQLMEHAQSRRHGLVLPCRHQGSGENTFLPGLQVGQRDGLGEEVTFSYCVHRHSRTKLWQILPCLNLQPLCLSPALAGTINPRDRRNEVYDLSYCF